MAKRLLVNGVNKWEWDRMKLALTCFKPIPHVSVKRLVRRVLMTRRAFAQDIDCVERCDWMTSLHMTQVNSCETGGKT